MFLNQDLTRYLVRSAFSISRELQSVLSLVKDHIPEAEYKTFARDIAAAVDAVNGVLLEGPLSRRPEIRAEIEATVARYGRYL